MKTLPVSLTLFGFVLQGNAQADGLVVKEATLEGIALLILLGGLLGVIKVIFEAKKVR
jgi:hypothetical protein